MKMTVVDELMNGSVNHKEEAPSPNAIGTEFARQYYTLLTDSPASVHKFYSHESTLLLNDLNVVGQKKIGLAIEELVGEQCRRIKITTINGVATFNNGIALQVFGELAGRRFVQTFILAPQGAKKYYVQNDIFHFVDNAFKSHPDTPEPSIEKIEAEPVQSHQPNGASKRVPNDSDETPILTSSDVDVVAAAVVAPIPTVVEKEKPVVQNGVNQDRANKRTPKKEEVTPKKKEEPRAVPIAVEPPVPVPVVDSTPKTWAKLVGGGASKPANAVPVAPAVVKTLPKVAAPAPKAQPPVTGATPALNSGNAKPQQASNDRRIYLGGITRKVVPESTTSAEQEIKDLFSKFGDVENVAMPRKVLDQPTDQNRPAFAFVTMKTAADVQNVLKSARKDDRGVFLIQMKITSFGFEGEANVSEQKDRPSDRPGQSGGFRGGRGGYGNSRGGSFTTPRGRGGRGSFRGGQNQGSHQ